MTGEFGLRTWGTNGILSHNESGVFSDYQSATNDTAPVANLNEPLREEQFIVFKASNGNSTYNGTTVQNPALQTLPCIRI